MGARAAGAGPQGVLPRKFHWGGTSQGPSKAVTAELAKAARAARGIHLPSWAELGWAELPAGEMGLLPQAALLREHQLADEEAGRRRWQRWLLWRFHANTCVGPHAIKYKHPRGDVITR